MPRRKHLIITLALLFILSTILAACGSSEQQADQGSTLVFGRGGDSDSLDPAQVTDGESIKVTQNLYETLVKYKKENTEVEPGLATEWEPSEDGLTWTFKLREGVKFHDGTDFNAEAVVFNFNRWMDKNNEYHKGGEFPYYGYMFGGYKGDEGHVIKSVKAMDDYTVEFTLEKPQGPFLNNLGMPAFGIASPTAVKKDPEKFGENPVGTGPFAFVEWKKEDSITLKKNTEYWDEGKPSLDRVIFRSIPDNAGRLTALKSGDIDLMDGLNPDATQSIEDDDKLSLYTRPPMNVGYLAFNTEKKPFDNVKVRQALNHAVNKEGLIKSFYNGLAEPAKNPMPPSLWGYNDEITDYEYDLDQAKKLLKEAGYEDGFKMELWAMPVPRPYMPDGKKIAEYLSADFEKLGIEVEIISMEWQTYLEKTGKGEHEAALLGWTGDNGDPDNFLYVLLDQTNAKGPDAGNIAFYKSEELHKLLSKAQGLSDKEERAKLYKEAQKVIKKDAPWVPMVHSTPPLASQSYVKGFIPHPTGSESLENVSIEK
ncbi:ABC transporter substrate-binding protein [Mechercharimyces sp. CAU 1602]|uniref:ABC transporter substrate-binding protein n=1 Tax=Mechercharimyces sp. CAU 1602 TaxID=2973933 RepID=UPI0021634282|nr:ABC transporter substrate-binding protein [Mechercharimyces sp. CAU 1602]MCS1351799.1 ABC transporter substrate-binding protein [Mechercharimyces sp. CAU 1602]